MDDLQRIFGRPDILALASVLALCLTTSACSPADDAAASDREGTSAAADINGDLLHTFSPEPEHRIEFWQLSQGVVGVREVRSVDDPQLVTAALLDQAQNLTELFRSLQPNAADVPALIGAADAQRPTAPGDGTGPLAAVLPLTAATQPKTYAQVDGCGDDVLDDNWGADWFLSQFPIADFKDRNWSRVNMASVRSPTIETEWFQWSVMAPEFVVGATASVEWESDWVCNGFPNGICGVTKKWLVQDVKVKSRTIQSFAFKGDGTYQGFANGDPSCTRVHALALWR